MAVAAATVEANEQRRRGISATSDSGISPKRDLLEMAMAEEGIKESIQMRFARNSRDREETHWRRLGDEEDEDDYGWDTDDRLLSHSKSSDSQVAGSFGRCRHSLRMMLDHPESSNAAYALQMVVMTVIVLSTISAVFETVPTIHQEYATFFSASEFIFTLLFSIEVVCRMVVAKSCRSYLCSISNQIDVIATLPWYVERIMVFTAPARDHSHLEKMAGSLRTLRMVRLARMVRLLRVLRLAKVARHSEVISIVLESLVESATGIFVLMSFVSMWALVCATVVYAAEIDAPDTDFVSIPAALWWSMATISTVGYGDMVPHTSIGKLVGGVSMLGGILITSISVAVITTSFTEHYQQRVRVHEVSKFKELAKKHSLMENANGDVSPDSSAVTRSRQPDVLASWQELEEEVQKHLFRMEAEILYRPLRTRPTDTHVALEMLKDQTRATFKQGTVLMQQLLVNASSDDHNDQPEKSSI